MHEHLHTTERGLIMGVIWQCQIVDEVMIAIIPHSFMVVRFSVTYVSSVQQGSSLFRGPLKGQYVHLLYLLDRSLWLLFKGALCFTQCFQLYWSATPGNLIKRVQNGSQCPVLFLPGSLLCATVYCTNQCLVLFLPGSLLHATVYCTSSYRHGCSMGCCSMSRESSS